MEYDTTTSQEGTRVPSLIEPPTITGKLLERYSQEKEAGLGRRELGLTWTGLTVNVDESKALVNENVLSQLNVFEHIKHLRHRPASRTILDSSHGCVKPGEMLLVLGRPGSGCTTLLKILANRRSGYRQVEGNVNYGCLTSEEAAYYDGQIIMNGEDEVFYPSLTVSQTLDFALRTKLPHRRPHTSDPTATSANFYTSSFKEFLLETLGISHTADTRVGNAFLRGVSGGERKRVSVLECLVSRASVFCWDNSTRGLDASSALDWAKAMRAMTDANGHTMVATLYQASNDILDQFDKVLVLDEGKQIFYGPRDQARKFVESQGFICQPGANVADFLTGVTVPSERRIRPGYETSFPRDAASMRDNYDASPIAQVMASEYNYPQLESTRQRTHEFQISVADEKKSSKSRFTAPFARQVRACLIREFQIIAGDKATFAMQHGSTLIQALIAGSLFYDAPSDSSGLFLKAGALNWSVLYQCLVAMSHVVGSFSGRPVVQKHASFAYIHPAAICISQALADLPITFLQVTIWSLIIYFLVGLKVTAGAFFTYFVFLFVTATCFNALFRAVGACFLQFDGASKVSGYAVAAMAMYSGYQIPVTMMHPWFGWLYWLNPLGYGFEALMANEFNSQHIDCVGSNLIPHGAEYQETDVGHQSCAGVGGSERGAVSLSGNAYLDSLSYNNAHIWRNFGILIAWWLFYVVVAMLATVRWTRLGSAAANTLTPREKVKSSSTRSTQNDEEVPQAEKASSSADYTEPGLQLQDCSTALSGDIMPNTSIMAWSQLSYTVTTPSGPRTLLQNINGWAKPGTLTALMGSSGAGKTTLLDVLAQRKTEGTISGKILIDGHPLPLSFQRSTGYCEQLDVHEPYTTVREALEFSALLRQTYNLPREDKLKYVDTIMGLLELNSISDKLIGSPGSAHGLNVEQLKRVTIGVELVAKPKHLIFLDEPTSGLDGQSAYKIIGLLRKLADAGQTVVVTVHQPSAQLFYQFDRLLLLAKGGRTVYFDEIGPEAQNVKDYFANHGCPCPPSSNPAEHMIDVVTGHISDRDWHETWLKSTNCSQATKEMEAIMQSSGATSNETTETSIDEDSKMEYATPLSYQIRVVLNRMNIALYRNTPYIYNKVFLHIGLALFNGFTYWMIGDTVADLQMRLFTIFVWMFVASGVINQLQPLFIERRDIYDAREKKSRIYSWKALVTALIVSELPYLVFCGVLYFVCWYYTVGFSADSRYAGGAFFLVLIYEFLYTGIGQFIAAYAPNAVFAALVNPLLVGILISFCGILVPYSQITGFWRYWLYYLNPTTYLVGGMLIFTVDNASVNCAEEELAVFDAPDNSTCGEYLRSYLLESGANLLNPDASTKCRVCMYTQGSDYLQTINLNGYGEGWRDVGIVCLFICSSYGLVYLLMKLRTKSSKKAE
ncbi:hypothetical protein FOXYS1_13544 [Fusarium oxysporum]|uniref:ABC transporter domain-containing protein n=1 Tax=Fusarium oxysporum TaxID=5507 RepID=A0A8H5A1Y3_FUSOX|nr:hypothetical protein FOXYS1_13544 [Fusarium oxysporum]